MPLFWLTYVTIVNEHIIALPLENGPRKGPSIRVGAIYKTQCSQISIILKDGPIQLMQLFPALQLSQISIILADGP